MMKKIVFILVLWLPMVGGAQTIKLKKLDKVRRECWKEYVRAVKDGDGLSGDGLSGDGRLGDGRLRDGRLGDGRLGDGLFGDELPALADGKNRSLRLPNELESDRNGNAVEMKYYYGYKGERPTAEKPSAAFLYLHGSGPRIVEWLTGLRICQRFADTPSVYVIPQIPQEGEWYRWYQKSKQWAYEKMWRQLLVREDIDPARLYLFGISEGGYGSQRLASFYADYLAASGPMAGGEPLKNAPTENLSNTVFSLRTGALDYGFYRDKLTGYTASSLDSLERLHPTLFRHWVELIPGRGHSIDYSPTPEFLRRHVRNPLPKEWMWEDFEMDGRHRDGFYYLAVDERPCDSLRTRYDVRVVKEADGTSVVTVDVRNVIYTTTETDPCWGIEMRFERRYETATGGAFTLFLDEHLVDLNADVRVVVNGKEAYAGKVKLNRRHLQRSLDLWGDPLRMMPAAVEVRY